MEGQEVIGDTTKVFTGSTERERVMLTLGMIVLGLAAFAAMLGFVTLCDRV